MSTNLPSIEEIAAQFEKKPAPAAPEAPVQDPEKEELTPPLEEETKDITGELTREAAPAPEQKKDPTASKFAALARREKQAREESVKLEQMRQDFARQQQSLQQQMADFQAKQDQFLKASNPIEALKARGWSYQDATLAAVGAYQEPEKDPVDVKVSAALDPVSKQLEEIKAAKDQLAAQLAELQEERAEIRRQAEVKEILGIAEKGGYEYVSTFGEEAATLVQNVISVYQKQHGRLLSIEEACDTIETYYTSYADKFANTSKVKSRFAAPAPRPAPQVKRPNSPEAKESTSPRTLTNSLNAGTHAKIDIDALPRHEALEHLATRIRFTD